MAHSSISKDGPLILFAASGVLGLAIALTLATSKDVESFSIGPFRWLVLLFLSVGAVVSIFLVSASIIRAVKRLPRGSRTRINSLVVDRDGRSDLRDHDPTRVTNEAGGGDTPTQGQASVLGDKELAVLLASTPAGVEQKPSWSELLRPTVYTHYIEHCTRRLQALDVEVDMRGLSRGRLVLNSASQFTLDNVRVAISDLLVGLAVKFRKVVVTLTEEPKDDSERNHFCETMMRFRAKLGVVLAGTKLFLRENVCRIVNLPGELEAALFSLGLMRFCVNVNESEELLPRRIPVEGERDAATPQMLREWLSRRWAGG